MTRGAGKSSADGQLAPVEQLGVFIGNQRVGTLASTPEGLGAFEYDRDWLGSGFSISPYSLPLQPGIFIPSFDPFDGLFGVFNDSLPDGWGALLLDRTLRSRGIEPGTVTPLTRLSIVGSGARGGLRYEPESFLESHSPVGDDLDRLATLCADIFNGEPVDNLDEMFAAGGSSAGARPKAYVSIDGDEWLIKFPSSMDPSNIGSMEYAYSQAARECGLNMPNTRLFASKLCAGYFGSRRFDRDAAGRGIHMITASGMLEVSHRQPLLDYRHLFQVTFGITKDETQVWDLFRLMCFNVFAHNQDDHSNNFSWLCEDGTWRLSPAYDLTYSTSFGGEHATTVNGNGQPGMQDVLELAGEIGLNAQKAKHATADIQERCRMLLDDLGLG